MQAFVEVDGVLPSDDLLLSSFARLFHHCCNLSSISTTLSPLLRTCLSAAIETLESHNDSYTGCPRANFALVFSL